MCAEQAGGPEGDGDDLEKAGMAAGGKGGERGGEGPACTGEGADLL